MKNPNGIITSHSTTVSCLLSRRVCDLLSCFKVIRGDDDPREMIYRFDSYFQENYSDCPAYFHGTLPQALQKALDNRSIEDVRRALLFRMND